MSPPLPTKPDFLAIEAEALKSADRRTTILALIGNLVFTWSNNESMFIYFIMVLMDTDEISAAIVFSTLNTTRARLDLIQRLAKIKIADRQLRKDLDDLIERFNATTRMRNEFNHAMYEVNAKGDITHTHSMRITEQRGKLKFGQRPHRGYVESDQRPARPQSRPVGFPAPAPGPPRKAARGNREDSRHPCPVRRRCRHDPKGLTPKGAGPKSGR